MAYRGSASSRTSAPNIYSRGSSVADAREGNVTSLELARPGFTRKMYRVLLAHDLTGRSEIAFVRAARLTIEREGHLTVLHVINSELPAPVIEARRMHAKSYLETEVRRWLALYKLSYRVDIGIGDTACAIAARAQAHDVNLVVTACQPPPPSHIQEAFPRLCCALVSNVQPRGKRQVLRSHQPAAQTGAVPVDRDVGAG